MPQWLGFEYSTTYVRWKKEHRRTPTPTPPTTRRTQNVHKNDRLIQSTSDCNCGDTEETSKKEGSKHWREDCNRDNNHTVDRFNVANNTTFQNLEQNNQPPSSFAPATMKNNFLATNRPNFRDKDQNSKRHYVGYLRTKQIRD
jgi:hypothetical protein